VGTGDANDGIALVAEDDGLADDAGVSTEAMTPEGVAEDDGAGSVGNHVLWKEAAAHDGRHLKDAEEAGGDAEDADGDGTVSLDEVSVAGDIIVGRHGGEGAVVVAEKEGVGASVRSRDGAVGEGALDLDQLPGMRKGQRFEHDAVEHEEDGEIGSDAEGEGGDGGGGEAGAAAELAQSVGDVLAEEGVHGCSPRFVTRVA